MTHCGDREPLLREEDDECHSDEDSGLLETFESCGMKSSTLIYLQKENFLPKTVLLVIGLCSVMFGMDQYRLAMRKIEDAECTDVLSTCSHIPFNQTLVPPFYNYLQDFTITPRLDISLCLLPKVISTIGTATICYLDDPEKFTAANRTISTEKYANRFCEKNEMKSYNMVKHHLNKNFDNIIVTRDPYDRFISGFTEKCVNAAVEDYCHGCGTDMRCFLRKEYRRLMRMSMLFPVYTVADTHFAPQTWYCDMKNTLKNSTIIRFSLKGIEKVKMIDDMLNVFRRRNVSERQLDEVREQLSLGKTHHSTTGSSLREEYERMIREDAIVELLALLVNWNTDGALLHLWLLAEVLESLLGPLAEWLTTDLANLAASPGVGRWKAVDVGLKLAHHLAHGGTPRSSSPGLARIGHSRCGGSSPPSRRRCARSCTWSPCTSSSWRTSENERRFEVESLNGYSYWNGVLLVLSIIELGLLLVVVVSAESALLVSVEGREVDTGVDSIELDGDVVRVELDGVLVEPDEVVLLLLDLGLWLVLDLFSVDTADESLLGLVHLDLVLSVDNLDVLPLLLLVDLLHEDDEAWLLLGSAILGEHRVAWGELVLVGDLIEGLDLGALDEAVGLLGGVAGDLLHDWLLLETGVSWLVVDLGGWESEWKLDALEDGLLEWSFDGHVDGLALAWLNVEGGTDDVLAAGLLTGLDSGGPWVLGAEVGLEKVPVSGDVLSGLWLKLVLNDGLVLVESGGLEEGLVLWGLLDLLDELLLLLGLLSVDVDLDGVLSVVHLSQNDELAVLLLLELLNGSWGLWVDVLDGGEHVFSADLGLAEVEVSVADGLNVHLEDGWLDLELGDVLVDLLVLEPFELLGDLFLVLFLVVLWLRLEVSLSGVLLVLLLVALLHLVVVVHVELKNGLVLLNRWLVVDLNVVVNDPLWDSSVGWTVDGSLDTDLLVLTVKGLAELLMSWKHVGHLIWLWVLASIWGDGSDIGDWAGLDHGDLLLLGWGVVLGADDDLVFPVDLDLSVDWGVEGGLVEELGSDFGDWADDGEGEDVGGGDAWLGFKAETESIEALSVLWLKLEGELSADGGESWHLGGELDWESHWSWDSADGLVEESGVGGGEVDSLGEDSLDVSDLKSSSFDHGADELWDGLSIDWEEGVIHIAVSDVEDGMWVLLGWLTAGDAELLEEVAQELGWLEGTGGSLSADDDLFESLLLDAGEELLDDLLHVLLGESNLSEVLVPFSGEDSLKGSHHLGWEDRLGGEEGSEVGLESGLVASGVGVPLSIDRLETVDLLGREWNVVEEGLDTGREGLLAWRLVVGEGAEEGEGEGTDLLVALLSELVSDLGEDWPLWLSVDHLMEGRHAEVLWLLTVEVDWEKNTLDLDWHLLAKASEGLDGLGADGGLVLLVEDNLLEWVDREVKSSVGESLQGKDLLVARRGRLELADELVDDSLLGVTWAHLDSVLLNEDSWGLSADSVDDGSVGKVAGLAESWVAGGNIGFAETSDVLSDGEGWVAHVDEGLEGNGGLEWSDVLAGLDLVNELLDGHTGTGESEGVEVDGADLLSNLLILVLGDVAVDLLELLLVALTKNLDDSGDGVGGLKLSLSLLDLLGHQREHLLNHLDLILGPLWDLSQVLLLSSLSPLLLSPLPFLVVDKLRGLLAADFLDLGLLLSSIDELEGVEGEGGDELVLLRDWGEEVLRAELNGVDEEVRWGSGDVVVEDGGAHLVLVKGWLAILADWNLDVVNVWAASALVEVDRLGPALVLLLLVLLDGVEDLAFSLKAYLNAGEGVELLLVVALLSSIVLLLLEDVDLKHVDDGSLDVLGPWLIVLGEADLSDESVLVLELNWVAQELVVLFLLEFDLLEAIEWKHLLRGGLFLGSGEAGAQELHADGASIGPLEFHLGLETGDSLWGGWDWKTGRELSVEEVAVLASSAERSRRR